MHLALLPLLLKFAQFPPLILLLSLRAVRGHLDLLLLPLPRAITSQGLLSEKVSFLGDNVPDSPGLDSPARAGSAKSRTWS